MDKKRQNLEQYNHKCLQCDKLCKQDKDIIVVRCKGFIKKGIKNEPEENNKTDVSV
jgi:hypothetical protein